MEMKKKTTKISGGRTLIYYTFTRGQKKTGAKKQCPS
jgi:hypothetical protein